MLPFKVQKSRFWTVPDEFKLLNSCNFKLDEEKV